MNEFRFTIIVKTDTADHAQQVINERIQPDEQYEDEQGVEFDYTIEQAGEDDDKYGRVLPARLALAEDEPNPVGDVLFFPKGGQA